MVWIVNRTPDGFTINFPRDSAVQINLLYCISPRSGSESQHFYGTQTGRITDSRMSWDISQVFSKKKKKGNNQIINTQNSVST